MEYFEDPELSKILLFSRLFRDLSLLHLQFDCLDVKMSVGIPNRFNSVKVWLTRSRFERHIAPSLPIPQSSKLIAIEYRKVAKSSMYYWFPRRKQLSLLHNLEFE